MYSSIFEAKARRQALLFFCCFSFAHRGLVEVLKRHEPVVCQKVGMVCYKRLRCLCVELEVDAVEGCRS